MKLQFRVIFHKCKESCSDSVQRIRYASACVYVRERVRERERESLDTEYTQANIY